MSTITNALIIPGVSAVHSELTLLVGLIIDDRRIAWGECTFAAADSDTNSQINDGIYILQEIIIPALMGQPLANMIALMEQIDQMRHEVTVVWPITAETPPPKRSRRELFTSLINPEQEIREVVERPLPPELRQGVSQALFSAAAMVENSTIVEAVARIYSLKPPRSPLPIHLIFDDLPNPGDPALMRITAASYGLTINDDNLVKELGSSGIRLQNRVRQLKNRVVRYLNNDYRYPVAGLQTVPQETGFLFDLKGGYGMLYEQNTGHILGALNGLEQVVKPYALRLVDPVIMDDRAGQMAIMKELKNFIGLRKMKTSLIARSWIETAEDIHALADNDCCGGVLLDMAQLGTLHRTVELALAAQERNLEVILAGVQGVAAVHTALALNPTLIAVNVGAISAVSDEINRTLAWLAYSG